MRVPRPALFHGTRARPLARHAMVRTETSSQMACDWGVAASSYLSPREVGVESTSGRRDEGVSAIDRRGRKREGVCYQSYLAYITVDRVPRSGKYGAARLLDHRAAL